MSCDSARKDILDHGDALSEATSRHVAACAECAELHETWRTLKDVPPPAHRSPPLSVDFTVKREAARFVENRRARSAAFRRWSAVCAIAACALIVCWTMIAMLHHATPSNGIRGVNQPLFARRDAIPSEERIEAVITAPSPASASSTSNQTQWEAVAFDDEFYELETELEYSQNTFRLGEQTNHYDDIFEHGDATGDPS